MSNYLATIFLKLLFGIEEIFKVNLINIPEVAPNKTTLDTLALLKKIYKETEDRGTKVWVTGSWAITGRFGKYTKQTRDVDLTMRTKQDEKDFSKALFDLGLRRKGNSPMDANRFIDPNTGIEIDFGSIAYPGTVYYNIPLNEKETVKINGFEFRVIPKEGQISLYKSILFNKGRSLRNDLVKLKILLHPN